jgi:hypothetical protein
MGGAYSPHQTLVRHAEPQYAADDSLVAFCHALSHTRLAINALSLQKLFRSLASFIHLHLQEHFEVLMEMNKMFRQNFSIRKIASSVLCISIKFRDIKILSEQFKNTTYRSNFLS